MVPRPRVANKMRAAFLEKFRQHELPADQQLTDPGVWAEEAEIQVYQEELERMKQGACLQMDPPGTFSGQKARR